MTKISQLSVLLLSFVAPGVAHAQLSGIPDPAPAAAPVSGPTSGGRPEAKTVGIGLGVGVPGDLTQPNTASVRIALTEDLILEPMLNLSFNSNSNRPGGAGAMTTSTSTTTLGLGVTGRLRMASRGPVDLAGLGSFSFTNVSIDQMTDTNQQNLAARWGLGVSWYFSQFWSLSLDALNPFFNLSHMGAAIPGGDSSITSWTFGAIFQPTVLMMVHLYM